MSADLKFLFVKMIVRIFLVMKEKLEHACTVIFKVFYSCFVFINLPKQEIAIKIDLLSFHQENVSNALCPGYQCKSPSIVEDSLKFITVNVFIG